MGSGNITGKVNNPTKVMTYTGKATDTAYTLVDNLNKAISVDVNLDTVQEKLVAGENIKTINGESILGEGNIAISGGTKLYKHEMTIRLSTGSSTKDVPIIFIANFSINQWQFSSIGGNSIMPVFEGDNYQIALFQVCSTSLIGFLKTNKINATTHIIGSFKDLNGNTYTIANDQSNVLVDIVTAL